MRMTTALVISAAMFTCPALTVANAADAHEIKVPLAYDKSADLESWKKLKAFLAEIF